MPAAPALATTSWNEIGRHTLTHPRPQMVFTTHSARCLSVASPVLRDSRDVLARQLFQGARAACGIYHLRGHSWAIEAHGEWARLHERTGSGAAGRSAEQ